jgi:hypothetical protein
MGPHADREVELWQAGYALALPENGNECEGSHGTLQSHPQTGR